MAGQQQQAAGWYGAPAADDRAVMASTKPTGAAVATTAAIPAMSAALASAETTMTLTR
jgi:hypothetical protein